MLADLGVRHDLGRIGVRAIECAGHRPHAVGSAVAAPRLDQHGKIRSGFLALHEGYVACAHAVNVDLLFVGAPSRLVE